MNGQSGGREDTVSGLETIGDGEGAGPQLRDAQGHADRVALSQRVAIVGLGVHEREKDLAGVDQAVQRTSEMFHEGLVGIMGMTKEVSEEESPGGIRIMEPDLELMREDVFGCHRLEVR